MAITVFQTNTEVKLAQMGADLLAKTATYDDSTKDNENAQILVWMWQLVKVLKVRQHATPGGGAVTARDRLLELVGGHSMAAFMPLVTMVDDVYNEFYAAFNSNDDPTNDSPFGTNLGDNGTGPVAGPVIGQTLTPGFNT